MKDNPDEFFEKTTKNMKEQHPKSHKNPTRVDGNSFLSRSYNHTTSFLALLIFAYVILLLLSYTLGYHRGSSFKGFVISKWARNPVCGQLEDRCVDPVPPELVRRRIIDLVYNGTSPYEGFMKTGISSHVQPNRNEGLRSYGDIYRSLIHKVQPKTIIKLDSFLGTSAIYLASLTRQLGLETQILSLDEFHARSGSRDLFEDIAMSNGDTTRLDRFMQYVISQNATKSILPVPLLGATAFDKLCEWGIYGDLIEVDMGLDFNSAWLDINRAYKLLRPGGVLFGHNHFASYNKGARKAVKLFARVNNFRVKSDGQHWMIKSA